MICETETNGCVYFFFTESVLFIDVCTGYKLAQSAERLERSSQHAAARQQPVSGPP
jgi:hypothetical protein